MKRSETYSEKIRVAARKLAAGRSSFDEYDIARALQIKDFTTLTHAQVVLRKMVADKILKREKTKTGTTYRLDSEPGNLTLAERLWRYMRAAQIASIEDLVTISGASRSYVNQWLLSAKRSGFIKSERAKSGKYRVIKDSIDGPRVDR